MLHEHCDAQKSRCTNVIPDSFIPMFTMCALIGNELNRMPFMWKCFFFFSFYPLPTAKPVLDVSTVIQRTHTPRFMYAIDDGDYSDRSFVPFGYEFREHEMLLRWEERKIAFSRMWVIFCIWNHSKNHTKKRFDRREYKPFRYSLKIMMESLVWVFINANMVVCTFIVNKALTLETMIAVFDFDLIIANSKYT